MICPDGCTIDHRDPSEPADYHTKELGHGLMLAYDQGEIRANWMPDWSEWVADLEDIEEAYAEVSSMLERLPDEFARFAATFKA